MLTCLQKIAILEKFKKQGKIKNYKLKTIIKGFNKEKKDA